MFQTWVFLFSPTWDLLKTAGPQVPSSSHAPPPAPRLPKDPWSAPHSLRRWEHLGLLKTSATPKIPKIFLVDHFPHETCHSGVPPSPGFAHMTCSLRLWPWGLSPTCRTLLLPLPLEPGRAEGWKGWNRFAEISYGSLVWCTPDKQMEASLNMGWVACAVENVEAKDDRESMSSEWVKSMEKAMVDVSTKTMSRIRWIRNQNHRFALVTLSIRPKRPPTGRRTLSAHSTSPRAKSNFRGSVGACGVVKPGWPHLGPKGGSQCGNDWSSRSWWRRRTFATAKEAILPGQPFDLRWFACVFNFGTATHESTSYIPTDWDLLYATLCNKVHRIGVCLPVEQETKTKLQQSFSTFSHSIQPGNACWTGGDWFLWDPGSSFAWSATPPELPRTRH